MIQIYRLVKLARYLLIPVSPVASPVGLTYCPCLLPTPIACVYCLCQSPTLYLLSIPFACKSRVNMCRHKHNTLQGRRGPTARRITPRFFSMTTNKMSIVSCVGTTFLIRLRYSSAKALSSQNLGNCSYVGEHKLPMLVGTKYQLLVGTTYFCWW